jgi:hypothetical protein
VDGGKCDGGAVGVRVGGTPYRARAGIPAPIRFFTVEFLCGLLSRCCWPRRAIKLPRKRSHTKANHRETD